MKHRRMVLPALGVLVGAAGIRLAPFAAAWVAYYRAEKMPVATWTSPIPVAEASGVAYHFARGTLLIVSDRGELVELGTDLAVRARYPIKGDLEGVAVHPATGTVFVALEDAASVVEYDLGERRILRTLHIAFEKHPAFRRGLKRNRGIEGVTVMSLLDGGYRMIVAFESGPARLAALSADLSKEATARARAALNSAGQTDVHEEVEVSAVYDIGASRLSDVVYDPVGGFVLAISSSERVGRFGSLAMGGYRAVRLPGRKPEGVCFLPNGDVVIVRDGGGLTICEGLAGWLRANVSRGADRFAGEHAR